MPTKQTCSNCNDNPRRKNHKYCLSCHAHYMRYWRKSHKLTPEQRKKMNCRSYANVYLRKGKLLKQPCNICGALKSQMHHPDYQKPLNVVWLCRPCHLNIHRETKS